MPIYNVLIFIIPYFLMIIFVNIKSYRYFSKIFCLIYLLALIIFLFNNPVTGGDILEYFSRYQTDTDYYHLEILFGSYTNFIKYLDFSANAYVVTLSISCLLLQLIIFSIICRKDILLSFILLLSNSFALLTWSGIYKNGLSIPFLLLAFYFLSNRNIILSFVFLTISCLFHTSSIIYYPVVLYLSIFRKGIDIERVIFAICAVCIFLSFTLDISIFKSLIKTLTIDYLKPFIPESMARPLRYFTAEVTEFNDSNSLYLLQTSRVQLEIFVQFSIFAFLSRNNIDNSTINFWRRSYLCSVFIYTLTIGVVFSYRFYLATSFLFTIFLYFNMIYSGRKVYSILSLYIAISYLIFCFYSLPPEKVGLMYLNPFNIGL